MGPPIPMGYTIKLYNIDSYIQLKTELEYEPSASECGHYRKSAP